MEAPPREDLDEEGPTAEEPDPVLPDLAIEMVKKWTMALDCWFPAALASVGGGGLPPSLPFNKPLPSCSNNKGNATKARAVL